MQHMMSGQVMLSLEIEEAAAVQASEGRWPRICERTRTSAVLKVRCAHVL